MTASRLACSFTGEHLFSDVYYHVLTKSYNLLFSSRIKQMVDGAWNSLSDGEKYEWNVLAKEVERMYRHLSLLPLTVEDKSAWFRSAMRDLSHYLYSPCTLGVSLGSIFVSLMFCYSEYALIIFIIGFIDSESSFWKESTSALSTGHATSKMYCLIESSTPFLSIMTQLICPCN